MVARWILSRRVLRGEEKQTAIRLRDLAFWGCVKGGWGGGRRRGLLKGDESVSLVHFFSSLFGIVVKYQPVYICIYHMTKELYTCPPPPHLSPPYPLDNHCHVNLNLRHLRGIFFFFFFLLTFQKWLTG